MRCSKGLAMQSDDDPQFNDSASDQGVPSRDELALEYLDQLPYEPYPFQEQAILSWFESKQGVLVCAPTGMGKTLIAEAGLYEALRTGKRAYYTTPLIALTEQKYAELQRSAERWGFDRSDVGLITGNRRENVDAKILVVVAEILFNRLLSSDAFDSFSVLNSNPEAPDPLKTTEPQNADAPKISAASLNAKRSLSVSWEEMEKDRRAPGFQEETQEPKTNLPEIEVDPSDFDDENGEKGELSNVHFSFDDVSVVVMDEFHQFTDPERGVVWEFTLSLLPPHVRTLLISATVGNANEFATWLRATSNRDLKLVQSTERKVPLVYEWVDDKLLAEQLEDMCKGTEEERFTPALVFCFNRDECWDVAEIAKGRNVVSSERQKEIARELERFDMKNGAGPKLRQLLLRGIGVHHAGILPRYRRIVEELFQMKLLSFCICTETLAAGINLPARSVVLPTLMKGPAGDKKLVESSSAHQIFGRAGRPQYDTRGFVFALCHEDDVRIARAKEKLDQIPADVKDPRMREMRKKLQKKLPKRRPGEKYWSQEQFVSLQNARASKLISRGPVPWRLLAHMLESNSDVRPLRTLVGRRLMSAKKLEIAQKSLNQMLLTLWRGGFVRLAPNPASYGIPMTPEATAALNEHRREQREKERRSRPFAEGLFDDAPLYDETNDESYDPAVYEKTKAKLDEPTPSPQSQLPPEFQIPEGFDFYGGEDLFNFDSLLTPRSEESEENSEPDVTRDAPPVSAAETTESPAETVKEAKKNEKPKLDIGSLSDDLRERLADSYRAVRAYPTPKIKTITSLRGVNPIYGTFLLEQLGIADRNERIQAFESLLEMPTSVARHVRPPRYEELPAGALANARLDRELLQLGLASHDELVPRTEEEEEEYWERRKRFGRAMDPPVYVIPFSEKLYRLFNYQYPGVSVRCAPVWSAGEIIGDFRGDFNKYILSKNLQKQEGVIFRHLLRLILLLEEFIPLKPNESGPVDWRSDLEDFAQNLIYCCREVDPTSVEETLNASKKADLLEKS